LAQSLIELKSMVGVVRDCRAWRAMAGGRTALLAGRKLCSADAKAGTSKTMVNRLVLRAIVEMESKMEATATSAKYSP
jgi:hypothetical protein